MEIHFETLTGIPLILFGIPNPDEERIEYKVAIPNLGSLILTHDWDLIPGRTRRPYAR